jgi:hypothetical protein
MKAFRATLMGHTARRLLKAASHWKVIAVFERSIYCQSAMDGIICAGLASIGGGPLNVTWDPPSGFSVIPWEMRCGLVADCDGDVLGFENGMAVLLADATVWRPEPLPQPTAIEHLAAQIIRLAKMVAAQHLSEGLGPLIPVLACPYPSSVAPSIRGDPLLALALTGIAALEKWLIMGLGFPMQKWSDPPPPVITLLGLGPGLTPSGDDFLGGVLITLRALGQPGTASKLADWLLPLARARTSRISRAHLSCAARGQGGAILHKTLSMLCTSQAPQLDCCLKEIGRYGHSSGWDALAGLVFAVTAYLKARARPGQAG